MALESGAPLFWGIQDVFSSRPVVCDDSGISGTVQVVVLPRRLQVEIRLAALAHEGHQNSAKRRPRWLASIQKKLLGRAVVESIIDQP